MALKRHHKAFLGKQPLFKPLVTDAVEALAQQAATCVVPPRAVLFREGEELVDCYVLYQGLVELFAQSGSRKVSVEVLEPPAIFPLSNVFGHASPVVSARSVRKSALISLPSVALRKLASSNAVFGARVAAEMSARCDHIMRRFSSHNLMYGIERVASYLLAENRRQGNTGIVRLSTRKCMLASSLGLAPESLSRALAMLRKCAIEVHGNEIRLVDIAQLEKVAGHTQGLKGMPVLQRSRGKPSVMD